MQNIFARLCEVANPMPEWDLFPLGPIPSPTLSSASRCLIVE